MDLGDVFFSFVIVCLAGGVVLVALSLFLFVIKYGC